VPAAAFPEVGIGLTGVSLAFGLTLLSGAYAMGPVSGGHFNPAESLGPVRLRRCGPDGSGDDVHVPDRDPGGHTQARSTEPALFVGDWALSQLWLFWVAPIVGAVITGWFSRAVFDSDA
jgi:glycerol uptake facilitator-like aquaporin